MTDDELADVLEGVWRDIETAVSTDQLDALRSTYPGWDIECSREPGGLFRWRAVLRRLLTTELKVAGVQAAVEKPDALSLASALAHQASLIHNNRFNGSLPPV